MVVINNAPCHRPEILHAIPGLSLIYLPPYSPELNPCERFFEELRRSTANEIYSSIENVEKILTKAINLWTPEKLKKLSGYSWILEQLGTVN